MMEENNVVEFPAEVKEPKKKMTTKTKLIIGGIAAGILGVGALVLGIKKNCKHDDDDELAFVDVDDEEETDDDDDGNDDEESEKS